MHRRLFKMSQIILVGEILIKPTFRVMLIRNAVFLVVVVALRIRKTFSRCSTKDDIHRIFCLIIKIKLHRGVECFQFLNQVVNSNVLHNDLLAIAILKLSLPTDVTRLNQYVTSLIIIPYFT